MAACGIRESRYMAASDHRLLVRFSRENSPEANDAALRLMRLSDACPLEGVRACGAGRDPRLAICLHGDSPGALAMARAVAATLRAAGVTIQPLAAG